MEGEDVKCQLPTLVDRGGVVPQSNKQACRHWYYLCDKIDKAFPLHFCILSLIKNWMVGRPGNKASVCMCTITVGVWILMLVPVWDVLCNSVDVICSGSHYGILAASVDQHLMCLVDSY